MRAHAIPLLTIAAIGVALLPSAAQVSPAPLGLSERWVFISHNFAVARNCDAMIEVIDRAARGGYNGIALTDCKFFRWKEIDEGDYARNIGRVVKAAHDHKMKVLAFCCGPSTDLLSNDPNLAEGQPVVDAPFVVHDGKLLPADDELKVVNGSFEEAKDGLPVGWRINGTEAAVDTAVKCEGKPSVRIQGGTQISQTLALKPNRYYRLLMKIKTEGLDPAYQFNVYLTSSDNKRMMCYKPFGVTKTQDWTEYSFEFNTMDVPEMLITTGIWGDFPGTVWIADMRIAPAGLVNLIRRDGCPFRVTSAGGGTVFAEGKDYAGARDPRLGLAVSGGVAIAGIYDYWHEPPVMTVPPGSRLHEGQRVRVSYYHAVTVYGWSTFPCLNEPAIWPLLRKHVDFVHRAVKPDGYILSHDEIRHAGWDESCRKAGRKPVEVLTDNIRRCAALVRREGPGKPLWIWGDMVDPNMNAQKTGHYCFVNGGEGPWYGSWEALDRDIGIVNWNNWTNNHRKESLRFFADRGHRQVLAGYYDAPVEGITGWMDDARGVPGVMGVMYTTWANRFDDLEPWLKRAEKAVAGGNR
jgi:hypothetical protein